MELGSVQKYLNLIDEPFQNTEHKNTIFKHFLEPLGIKPLYFFITYKVAYEGKWKN